MYEYASQLFYQKTKRYIMSNNHFFAYIWLAETHYMAFKL